MFVLCKTGRALSKYSTCKPTCTGNSGQNVMLTIQIVSSLTSEVAKLDARFRIIPLASRPAQGVEDSMQF